MKKCYFLIMSLFLILPLVKSQSTDGPVHEFGFKGGFSDLKGTGIELTIHTNTATEGFGTGEWWWTANTEPGGGLILETDFLTDPNSYSLGIRFKFDDIGSGYKKIMSFKGKDDDNGLYFLDNNLVFYPFDENYEIEYDDSVYYDFIFSRSNDDTIRVYVVQEDGTITKIYEEFDELDASVPVLIGDSVQFMFFMDDESTGGEYTSGGAVKGIRVWDRPLQIEEIADALSDAKTLDATEITSTSAKLHGTVNPNKVSISVDFEYGLTDLYGLEIDASPGSLSDSVNVDVSAVLSDLIPDTVYYFRVRSVSATDTVYGSEKTFRTLAQFLLTYSAGDNGTISGNTNQTVDAGSDGSEVQAEPDPGYIFVKWSDEVTENPRTDTNVTMDISVTAIFEEIINAINNATINEISIYPIPVNNFINIELQNEIKFFVTVTDLLGRNIYSESKEFSKTVSINFSEMTPGTYILRVYNENDLNIYRKIVKK
jgi:hypothetical protein